MLLLPELPVQQIPNQLNLSLTLATRTRLSLLRTLQFSVPRNANNTPKPQCKTRLRNTPPFVTPNSPFQSSLH